ncbi:MAG: phosphatase PAP2 family protein [Pseudomonadota bacterium]
MIDAFQGGTPVGLRPAPVCPTPRFGTTHREQFIAEDDPKEPIGVNVGDYVCSLSDAEIAKVMQEMEIALDSTKLQGLFWLKRELCRPRPYQTALLLGINGFYYDRAISATHSSIYSGHCLEGILSAATVFDRWRNDSRYSNEDIDRLAHYAVDFGDRRVFAGVHYPSDNVVSWWMAASLIGELFADPEPVRAFVVAAVRTHSLVYRAIAERIGEDALNGARVLLEEVDLLNEQSNS